MEISQTGQKYIGIDKNGRRAVKNAEVLPFAGFQEDLRDRFLVAAKFNQQSVDQLQGKVITPIKQIEQDLNCQYLLAGRDFPLHTTLLEGLYQGVDGDEAVNADRDINFSAIADKLSEESALNELVGLSMVFKYVLLDKGNILLTAIEIPETVLKLRSQLNEIYGRSGLKPLSLDNILHLSLARLIKMPDEEMQKSGGYHKRIRAIRRQIAAQPVTMTISNIYRGDTFDFLSSHSQSDKVTE